MPPNPRDNLRPGQPVPLRKVRDVIADAMALAIPGKPLERDALANLAVAKLAYFRLLAPDVEAPAKTGPGPEFTPASAAVVEQAMEQRSQQLWVLSALAPQEQWLRAQMDDLKPGETLCVHRSCDDPIMREEDPARTVTLSNTVSVHVFPLPFVCPIGGKSWQYGPTKL